MGKASGTKLARKTLLASNSVPSSPSDETTAPGMALSANATSWLGDEATTNAVSAADRAPYAQSGAELVDRVLQRGISIPRRTSSLVLILAWIVFIGWSFSQDNGAGKLDTFDGIRWFFGKACAITVFGLIAGWLILKVTED
jgi:hypothetical protein